MKNIRLISTAVAFLTLVCCQKPLEKEYGLVVDSNEYAVSADGKTFPIYVYSSSSWTAAFDNDVDWAEIVEGKSGSGVGMAKLNIKANYGEARSVNLILTSGLLTQTILIRQGGHSVTYHMTYAFDRYSVAKGSYLVCLSFNTNIPSEAFSQVRASSQSAWVTAITGYTILTDNNEVGAERSVTGEFSFIVRKNDTGALRSMTLGMGLPDEYSGVNSLLIDQTSDAPYIRIDAPSEPFAGDAHECLIEIDTNLVPLVSDMNATTSADYIRNLRVELENGKPYLKFRLEENETEQNREAQMKVSYKDLNNTLTEAVITISQR